MLTDLDEIRTFERILACGSLSAAARDLGVGLTVVSKRLASLERRVGSRLIQRTSRELRPTEGGSTLLSRVTRMLAEIRLAEDELRQAQGEPSGLLRVSSPVTFGRNRVAPLVQGLLARFPRLRVDLRLDDRDFNLVEERIDVAVRMGMPGGASTVVRKLADNRRVLVAAPRYLDRHGRPDTPEEVEALHHLRYGGHADPWRLEGPDGAAVEIPTRSPLLSADAQVAYDGAVAGLGVMLKSEIELADDLRDGRLERVLPGHASAPAPLVLALPTARGRPAKVQAFIDAMCALALAGPRSATRLTAPARR